MSAVMINIIIAVVLEAIKEGPVVYEDVKKFIANLNQIDWTTEQIQALIAVAKPPEQY